MPSSAPDPDEIAAGFAAGFAEAIPDGQHERILSLIAHSSHPDAARVLDVIRTYHPDLRVAKNARRAARDMAKHRAPARAGVR